MKFCTKCGNQLEDMAVICNECGCSTEKKAALSNNAAKSRMVAGLLQIFLGSLGIGRFYLGYKQIGMMQLFLGVFGTLVGFVGVFTYIPAIRMLQYASTVAVVWGVIDGILILTNKKFTDFDGNKLTD